MAPMAMAWSPEVVREESSPPTKRCRLEAAPAPRSDTTGWSPEPQLSDDASEAEAPTPVRFEWGGEEDPDVGPEGVRDALMGVFAAAACEERAAGEGAAEVSPAAGDSMKRQARRVKHPKELVHEAHHCILAQQATPSPGRRRCSTKRKVAAPPALAAADLPQRLEARFEEARAEAEAAAREAERLAEEAGQAAEAAAAAAEVAREVAAKAARDAEAKSRAAEEKQQAAGGLRHSAAERRRAAEELRGGLGGACFDLPIGPAIRSVGGVPLQWSPCLGAFYEEVDLSADPADGEQYAKVKELFNKTSGDRQILGIYRIQNVPLFQLYHDERERLWRQGSKAGGPVEALMWHGSRFPGATGHVCRSGFGPRSAAAAAAGPAYVELSESSKYAERGCCCEGGRRRMLLVLASLGPSPGPGQAGSAAADGHQAEKGQSLLVSSRLAYPAYAVDFARD